MGLFDKLEVKLREEAIIELNDKIKNGDDMIKVERFGIESDPEFIGFYMFKKDADNNKIKEASIDSLVNCPDLYDDITNYNDLKRDYISTYVEDRMNVILHNLTQSELATSPEDIVDSILEDL